MARGRRTVRSKKDRLCSYPSARRGAHDAYAHVFRRLDEVSVIRVQHHKPLRAPNQRNVVVLPMFRTLTAVDGLARGHLEQDIVNPARLAVKLEDAVSRLERSYPCEFGRRLLLGRLVCGLRHATRAIAGATSVAPVTASAPAHAPASRWLRLLIFYAILREIRLRQARAKANRLLERHGCGVEAVRMVNRVRHDPGDVFREMARYLRRNDAVVPYLDIHRIALPCRRKTREFLAVHE